MGHVPTMPFCAARGNLHLAAWYRHFHRLTGNFLCYLADIQFKRIYPMINSDGLFTGPIPQLYNQLMVPMLFDAYARDLASDLETLHPTDILETAAGSGALTRAIAARLPVARITATDLNQPMLDVAASLMPNDTRITWAQCDATDLPYPDAAFDAVACQFGVMFFPDKPKAFTEAARVLRKGGSFIFNVWDKVSENEFVAAAAEALAERFPNDPPEFMARVPHGLFDTSLLSAQLLASGFASCDVKAINHRAVAATPMDAATAYCQGTPLRAEILARDPDGLGPTTQAVAAALETHFGPGPISGKIRAFVLTAVNR
jgi:SAM-dependent methyltransferase